MPLVLADRVRETTTTTGTGTIFLAGPVSGFQGFSTAIGNGNTTYYTIVEAATGAWEVGIGTYTSAGSLLSRDTVLSSTNSGSLVPFGVGTKDVFVAQPAERAVYVLGAGTGLAAGAAAFTANGVPYASATNTLTTGSALTFDGTRLTSTTGKFGGGAASNSASLMVNNATNTATGIQLFQDGIESWIMGMPANSAGLAWSASGSEQMRLTSTGLGIGTTSPPNKLTVSNAGANGFEFDPANSLMQTYNRSGGAYTAMNLLALSIAFKTGISPVTTMTLDTSGNLSMAAAGAITSSRINPRTSTAASTATLTPDIQAADQYNLTAQAAALAINAPTGTPVDGNKLLFRILDNGSAQTITWDGTYTVIGTTLPTTTTANKMTYVGCIYNAANTRWDVVAVTTQA